jgi:hypothetical protein
LSEDKHVKLDAVFAIQIVVLAIGIGQDYLLALFKNGSVHTLSSRWSGSKNVYCTF